MFTEPEFEFTPEMLEAGITPEMIEAGVEQIHHYYGGSDVDEVVAAIYVAMHRLWKPPTFSD